jgi:nucleoside-diphosphate-sugar epimerase
MLDSTSLTAATEGAGVLYAVVGLPYAAQVWQRDWPPAMRNLISAVEANGCKLVFLDNVYAYGLVAGAMTEATAYNPCSRKGEVRARIATELMDADKTGRILATIGRSADFYGPEALLSTFGERFFKGALGKGKAEWLCSTKTLHAFNYTPDNARALATLGEEDAANGKIWHLPSAEALVGDQFIALVGELLGKPLKPRVLSRGTIRLVGLFSAQLREIPEMLYQNDHDYVFDSRAFTSTFGEEPTTYRDGLVATLQWFQSRL